MAAAPLFEARGLGKRFGGLQALADVSLSVGRGEILGLIGPNGSGKTTFFNVVTGIYRPDSGGAMLDGREIGGLSAQAIYRAGVTRTFQRCRLSTELSIFDELMIGAHKDLDLGFAANILRRKAFRAAFEERREQARALLAVFSAELAQRMFEPIGRFPMIDRRRIEICRALISRPRLLLLDEPSAGMTHDETRQLMDDILETRRGNPDLAVVIIEHEMPVIERVSDRCVVFNYGRKIAEGSYREVASDPQVQEAYLGSRHVANAGAVA